MKKIINISLCLFFLAGFSSCLKDDTIIGPDSPGAITHVVEFKNPAVISSGTTDKMPYYIFSYDIVPAIDLNVEVSYSGAGTAPNDIQVKLALDNDAIEIANEEQGLSMIPIRENMYSLSSLDVTIPKGQKTGIVKITFKTDQFDLAESYALALKIVSVTGTKAPISGNFNTVVLSVGAKNKYDGEYRVTGTMVDLTNGAFTGLYPAKYYLITQTANSVAMFDPTYFGDYIHLMKNGSSVSGYGSFSPQLFFDANDNVIKIENAYGQPAGNGRSAQLDPTGVNKRDADGTIRVKYFLLQPGSSVRSTFDETFTRVGPR